MKPKKLRLVLLMLFVLAIGGAIWLFSQTPEYTATATLRVIPGVKAEVPKAVVQTNQVEKPQAAAVGAKSGATDSLADNAALAQAELKNTVKDMARIMREKGGFAFELAFYPDFAARMQREPKYLQQRLDMDAEDMQNPQFHLHLEEQAQKYDHLATLTPTLNVAGDKAIYYGPNPDDSTAKDVSHQKLAILIKINGKWYWQADWSGE